MRLAYSGPVTSAEGSSASSPLKTLLCARRNFSRRSGISRARTAGVAGESSTMRGSSVSWLAARTPCSALRSITRTASRWRPSSGTSCTSTNSAVSFEIRPRARCSFTMVAAKSAQRLERLTAGGEADIARAVESLPAFSALLRCGGGPLFSSHARGPISACHVTILHHWGGVDDFCVAERRRIQPASRRGAAAPPFPSFPAAA